MPLRPLRRPAGDDDRLVDALQAGDERAFQELVDRHHAALVRLAQTFVRDRAVAEEVAQETWLAVLQGIDRFERRSSLKTWIFRILTNRAKTRALRERREIPFSAIAEQDTGPSVDPERFNPPDAPAAANMWSDPPCRRAADPEAELLSAEQRRVILDTIATLPPAQQAVITMRDIEGFDADDVCNFLDITGTNQRVLLHRARARVRQALEDYAK